MTTMNSQARLIARDENLDVRQKKVTFDGRTKSLKGGKNGREGIAARRPLGDLTNKRNIHVEMGSKKPTASHNGIHKSDECFLHDHNKCIDAKISDHKVSVLDVILPKCNSVFTENKGSARAKEDLESSLNPDEMEIPDMLQWGSPSPFYKHTNSPSSTSAWKFEPVEFVLKDEKTRNSKGAGKKGTEGITTRKPLGDLTNKRNTHVEVTTKNRTAAHNELNIAEECFLHDHSKCIDAKNTALQFSLLDLILPKCDTVFRDSEDSMQAKDIDSFLNPDELEVPDLLQWDSPPPLYKRTTSLPPSPCSWQFESAEFVLKDENDVI